MSHTAHLPWYMASHTPEIGSRNIFFSLLYDQILKTSSNLFLKEQLLFLLTPLKSSRLNPVYPRWWSWLLVEITLSSFLSCILLNLFPVSIWEYIRRRITVIAISSGDSFPVEKNFFFQTTYSQDNEFTWRRRQLTLLKRQSIWFRVVPEVLLLSLSCIWTGSTYRNGSKIVSKGKGFVPNRRVSRFPLIVNCDKWIRQGRGVEIRDQYNGIAQTWQLNYRTCCLFLYSLFVFVSCNEIGRGDDPW